MAGRVAAEMIDGDTYWVYQSPDGSYGDETVHYEVYRVTWDDRAQPVKVRVGGDVVWDINQDHNGTHMMAIVTTALAHDEGV